VEQIQTKGKYQNKSTRSICFMDNLRSVGILVSQKGDFQGFARKGPGKTQLYKLGIPMSGIGMDTLIASLKKAQCLRPTVRTFSALPFPWDVP
jgi:hypothetical protein